MWILFRNKFGSIAYVELPKATASLFKEPLGLTRLNFNKPITDASAHLIRTDLIIRKTNVNDSRSLYVVAAANRGEYQICNHFDFTVQSSSLGYVGLLMKYNAETLDIESIVQLESYDESHRDLYLLNSKEELIYAAPVVAMFNKTKYNSYDDYLLLLKFDLNAVPIPNWNVPILKGRPETFSTSIDATDNVFVFGRFNLVNNTLGNMFLARFPNTSNGDHFNVITFGASYATAVPHEVIIDNLQNIVCVAMVEGLDTIIFEDMTLVLNSRKPHLLIAKFENTDRMPGIWARAFEYVDLSDVLYNKLEVEIDTNNDIIVAFEGLLMKLDGNTGDIMWNTTIQTSTNFPLALVNDKVYMFTSSFIFAYSTHTGQLLETKYLFNFTTPRITSTIVDILYFGKYKSLIFTGIVNVEYSMVGRYTFNCSCNNNICNIPACYGFLQLDQRTCNERGYCAGINQCTCSKKYSGKQCNEPVCFDLRGSDPSVCSKHGKCVDVDTCFCDQDYSGKMCEIPSCFGTLNSSIKVCSSNGICQSANVCKCNSGYTGQTCNRKANYNENLYICNEGEYMKQMNPPSLVSSILYGPVPPDQFAILDFYRDGIGTKFFISQSITKNKTTTCSLATIANELVSYSHCSTTNLPIVPYDMVVIDRDSVLIVGNCATRKTGLTVNYYVLSGKKNANNICDNKNFNKITLVIFTSITRDENYIYVAGTSHLTSEYQFFGCVISVTKNNSYIFQLLISAETGDAKCVYVKVLSGVIIPTIFIQQDTLIALAYISQESKAPLQIKLFRFKAIFTLIHEQIIGSVSYTTRMDNIEIRTDLFGNIVTHLNFEGELNITVAQQRSFKNSGFILMRMDTQGFPQLIITTFGDSESKIHSTDLDASGNIFVTGNVRGNISYNGIDWINTTETFPRIFMAQFTPYGELKWAITSNSHSYGSAIRFDSEMRRIYLTGCFMGQEFNFFNTTLVSENRTNCTAFLLTFQMSHCLLCPIDTYSSSPSLTEICEPCKSHEFTRAPGASSCERCDSGLFFNSTRNDCSNCSIGYYCPDGFQQLECNQNEYSDKESLSACEQCSYGYTVSTGATQCIRCPVQWIQVRTFSTCVLSILFAIVIPVSVVGVVLIALFLCGFGILFKKYRKAKANEKTELEHALLADTEIEMKKTKPELTFNAKMFEINFADLKNFKEIGRGASGAVCFKATLHSQLVAVKIFKMSMLASDDPFSELENELNFLAYVYQSQIKLLLIVHRNLRHPNVVSFFGIGIDPPRVCIVLEYCENGSLYSLILQDSPAILSISQRLQLLIEIASGMEYLHSKGIIHRDLKSDNILLDKNLTPKIADFGVSKLRKPEQEVKMTRYVGTSWYMSPEVCRGEPYDNSCDVFSFGIVMWEVLNWNIQPYGQQTFGIEFKVANDPNFRPSAAVTSDAVWEKQFIDLMQHCYAHQPNERPTFEAITSTLADIKEKSVEPS